MRKLGAAMVHDGEQALKVIADDEPEVMVLDLKMPGINGIEVLRNVKKNHPNVEVIILTGHGSSKDEEETRKLGAFAYLQKPVDISTLTDTIKKAYENLQKKGFSKK